MTEGWKCPNCGKAHGPHVDTCPEPRGLASPLPYPWPGTRYDPPPIWPPYTTCADPPGTCTSGCLPGSQVYSNGQPCGPSD